MREHNPQHEGIACLVVMVVFIIACAIVFGCFQSCETGQAIQAIGIKQRMDKN